MNEAVRISVSDRNFRNNHKSAFVLLTGLSGAGKTTLCRHVERILFDEGKQTFVLDGDALRAGLSKDLGFDTNSRKENQRRILETGKLFLDAGMVVLVSSIAPIAQKRQEMREGVQPYPFIEVYVKCPLEICERRDPKGLYGKVRQGEIQNFTGILHIYEEPTEPDLIVETHRFSAAKCAMEIVTRILDVIRLTV